MPRRSEERHCRRRHRRLAEPGASAPRRLRVSVRLLAKCHFARSRHTESAELCAFDHGDHGDDTPSFHEKREKTCFLFRREPETPRCPSAAAMIAHHALRTTCFVRAEVVVLPMSGGGHRGRLGRAVEGSSRSLGDGEHDLHAVRGGSPARASATKPVAMIAIMPSKSPPC